MELNTTFAMKVRQTFRHSNYKSGYFLYPFGNYLCKDTTVSFPLWTSIFVMYVWSLATLRRTNGFPIYGLFNSFTMPNSKGIKASAKYSNTPFTSSHETAVNQFYINPTLSQMLFLAGHLLSLAEKRLDYLNSLPITHDDALNTMIDISDKAGEIICLLGRVIGLDLSEQGFNLHD